MEGGAVGHNFERDPHRDGMKFLKNLLLGNY
jgi:hypothetical protein